MARILKTDTPRSPYLSRGYSWHNSGPQIQWRVRNFEAARGRLKQQNRRSDTERLMINMAVVFRTCQSFDIKIWSFIIWRHMRTSPSCTWGGRGWWWCYPAGHTPGTSRSRWTRSLASSRGNPTKYLSLFSRPNSYYAWNSGVDKNNLQSAVALIETEVMFSVLRGSISEVSPPAEFILYSLSAVCRVISFSDRKLIYHLYQ